jgi:23S rRNA (cytosine1962-C5)-methyltransferase
MEKFQTFIKDAFKKEKIAYQILEEYRLPADFRTSKSFREGNYLKVVFIKKLG